MSYGLQNKKGKCFHLGQGQLFPILNFALLNGWTPEEHIDSGHYYENSGQLISEREAKNIGKAIKRGLKKKKWKDDAFFFKYYSKTIIPVGNATSEDFAEYCLLGEFTIT